MEGILLAVAALVGVIAAYAFTLWSDSSKLISLR